MLMSQYKQNLRAWKVHRINHKQSFYKGTWCCLPPSIRRSYPVWLGYLNNCRFTLAILVPWEITTQWPSGSPSPLLALGPSGEGLCGIQRCWVAEEHSSWRGVMGKPPKLSFSSPDPPQPLPPLVPTEHTYTHHAHTVQNGRKAQKPG